MTSVGSVNTTLDKVDPTYDHGSDYKDEPASIGGKGATREITIEGSFIGQEEQRHDEIVQQDQARQANHAYLFAAFLCLLISFAGFVFGWDTGTIGGLVTMPDFIDRFGYYDSASQSKVLDGSREGIIVSIFNIGAAVGGLTYPRLGDLYGRRIGLLMTLAVYVVGVAICISSSTSWIQYLIGRLIQGSGVGAITVLCPIFISETAPRAIRGTLVSFFQMNVTFGLFIGNCLCYGTYHHYSDARSWRIVLGLGFVWAFIAAIGIVMSPESPRYLVANGRIEEACRSIARVNRMKPDCSWVEWEVEAVQRAIDKESGTGSASWSELITGQPKVLYRVIMGVVLQSLQQLTGDNYFFYYGTTVFKSVGLSDSYETNIIFGVVNFGATFASFYTVDHFGRKLGLLVGGVGMAVCLLAYATIGSQSLYSGDFGVNPNIRAGNAMIFVACLFITFFAFTWGPTVSVIVSESYPLRIRSKAMAVTLTANWIWGFMIGYFTPTISAKLHFVYGYVFLGCVVFGIFFVCVGVPETKGLSLEDIEELYTKFTPGLAYRRHSKDRHIY